MLELLGCGRRSRRRGAAVVSRFHDAFKNDPRYKAWRLAVLEAGGHSCSDCGSEHDLTADHITPVSKGGDPFDVANGRCLCRPCNSRRGNRGDKNVRGNYYNPRYLESL